LTPALSATDTPSPEALEREYLDCLLAPNGRRARKLVQDALHGGLPASTIYLRVIAPAMVEVGRLWETAQIGVAQEHLATQISQMVIAALGSELVGSADVGQGRVAIAASSPGELHALGTQMVADFLETQGWQVLALGADTPLDALVDLVRRRGASLVTLSTALPGHLLAVTHTCQRLRALPDPPFVVVGGRAYGGEEPRALATGADAFAEDPDTLLSLLAVRFGADAS
jgi:MerR family transcriptional regulator, light-induced transcriptional regulator